MRGPASGSPTSCPTTARPRHRPDRRASPRSGSGARGPATSSPALTGDDVSDDGLRLPDLPRDRGRRRPRCSPRGSPTSASSAGSSTSPIEQAAALWEALLEAGAPHGAVPVGIGVYGTTGRIEKGYRAFGYELDAERSIVEAGMQRPEGQGRRLRRPGGLPRAARGGSPGGAVHADRRRPHLGVAAMKRYMLGGEPILTRSGEPLTDGHGHHPYVTTRRARRRRSASTCCWPTCRRTRPSIGNELAVSYMEELYPVTVGSVDVTAAASTRPTSGSVCMDRTCWSASSGWSTLGGEVDR